MYTVISLQTSKLKSSFSKDTVISLNNVGKLYKLYTRPLHRVAEALLPRTNDKYHQQFHALNDVSFTVERGQTVGIIGQNGSGKSTLLQIVCGILQPSAGQVVVDAAGQLVFLFLVPPPGQEKFAAVPE
ncbi:MAG: ABC transporter ATP-binding protein [Candidatus Electrothrix sp. AR4]|nr:ABC transporter ATP-binding protein [Candidatus Electrothrix sp. AR4]